MHHPMVSQPVSCMRRLAQRQLLQAQCHRRRRGSILILILILLALAGRPAGWHRRFGHRCAVDGNTDVPHEYLRAIQDPERIARRRPFQEVAQPALAHRRRDVELAAWA